MLFGEKYGETVRVLGIGAAANCAVAPMCSAPVTSACSKVVAEGVAAGVRRIRHHRPERAGLPARHGAHRATERGQLELPVADLLRPRISLALEQVKALERRSAHSRANSPPHK